MVEEKLAGKPESGLTPMSKPSSECYHGTRVEMRRGDQISPRDGFVYFTPTLDAAIWAAELSEGEGAPHVYVVRVSGLAENAEKQPDYERPAHPAMSWRCREPLTVLIEVTAWTHYHGTRAELRPGERIEPGHAANFGAAPRSANFVYFTRTLDAAIWGAELAAGEGPGRIYVVEPTGAFEDDPNLTNMRFRGNPTKSFRSRAPLRVTSELEQWTGHPPDAIRAMKEGLARLEQQGVERTTNEPNARESGDIAVLTPTAILFTHSDYHTREFVNTVDHDGANRTVVGYLPTGTPRIVRNGAALQVRP